MARILLLGRGQLGRALAGVLPLLGETTICCREKADLRYPDELGSFLDQLNPELIFNAAAYTKIDAAENDEETVMAINGEAPAALATWAKDHGAELIHFSTDYVFDGTKEEPYLETDEANPLNVYGRAKLKGDKAIERIGGSYFIFRTGWIYGPGGRNFPSTFLRLAQTRETLEVVDNQVGAPTSAEFLAISSILATFQPQKAYGLYNLTASGSISWYGLAQYLLKWATDRGALMTLKPENLIPVQKNPEYPAPRPANSVLSNAKFRRTFGIRSPEWPFGLDRYLETILGL
ncbi:MAG: dTDP-4-dehydrorhamnose reductase [Deltaproteobacteria bacterium]|jgi:dTDP-4-dehydrorhamnose reductase|nr:dTDP-4-dehydrorhamnose reductase [Deltaproteobacteria bacterium]